MIQGYKRDANESILVLVHTCNVHPLFYELLDLELYHLGLTDSGLLKRVCITRISVATDA